MKMAKFSTYIANINAWNSHNLGSMNGESLNLRFCQIQNSLHYPKEGGDKED